MANVDIQALSLHFILGKERTGSSMLTAMLNQNEKVLSPSEEPFLIYFHNKYKNKKKWSENQIEMLLKKFWLMHEKSLEFYFSSFEDALHSMIQLTKNKEISYLDLCKCIYLQFLPHKEKSNIESIIDKQLKYPFYLKKLYRISPNSKIIFIVRDPRENVIRSINRKLGKQDISYQAQVWLEYFKNIQKAKNIFKENVLVIKYEDLVIEPKKTLQLVCHHFQIGYHENMISFSESYQTFLETKSIINPDFANKLANFHSSLLKPLDKEKIRSWEKHKHKKDIKTIERITFKLASELGYDIPIPSKKLTVRNRLMMISAKFNKTFVLKLYLTIPFNIKIYIKKRKKKNITP